MGLRRRSKSSELFVTSLTAHEDFTKPFLFREKTRSCSQLLAIATGSKGKDSVFRTKKDGAAAPRLLARIEQLRLLSRLEELKILSLLQARLTRSHPTLG